jgi:hypothetical protein
VIRDLANEALAALAGEFSALYAPTGWPSIPPEKLPRVMLLQAFYLIRSEQLAHEVAQFRPGVSLACGARDRRFRLGSLDPLKEPRPAQGQEVLAHAVIALEMTDDWLDRRASPQLARAPESRI